MRARLPRYGNQSDPNLPVASRVPWPFPTSPSSRQPRPCRRTPAPAARLPAPSSPSAISPCIYANPWPAAVPCCVVPWQTNSPGKMSLISQNAVQKRHLEKSGADDGNDEDIGYPIDMDAEVGKEADFGLPPPRESHTNGGRHGWRKSSDFPLSVVIAAEPGRRSVAFPDRGRHSVAFLAPGGQSASSPLLPPLVSSCRGVASCSSSAALRPLPDPLPVRPATPPAAPACLLPHRRPPPRRLLPPAAAASSARHRILSLSGLLLLLSPPPPRLVFSHTGGVAVTRSRGENQQVKIRIAKHPTYLDSRFFGERLVRYQIMAENHFSLLQRETEKLPGDIDKMRSELKYEIDKVTAGQLLDLNLERGEYIKKGIEADDMEALYKVHAAICADPTFAKYNAKKLTYEQRKATLVTRLNTSDGADEDEGEEDDE
ncbi:hypothetical protein U9M48_041259 [Paspalum notatum var. saurae]|uniref:Uncharacterized protein n=1 Tax=Paspalum notatum var. saurae TaxID=547442 RepID=A0AAQ3UNM4_PASNO